MDKLTNKIKRQDRKYSKKYKLITHDIPLGMSKSAWWNKKHGGSKKESPFSLAA